MFCPNCGKELKEGAKFCGGCGNPITPVQETAPVATATIPAPQTEQVERAIKKKLPTGVKVLIAVVIVLVVLGSVFAGLWFGTDLFKGDSEENLCKICEEKIEQDEKYCEDCIEKYTCKECETVDKDVKDGYCPDCLNNSSFCKECEEKLEEGFYCADCIEMLGATDSFCFICGTDLSQNEICLIDNDGYFYCEDCDTGNYCVDCGSPIDAEDDDVQCQYCAEYSCYRCGEVIGEGEIDSWNEYEEPLCETCAQDGAEPEEKENNAGENCWNCGIPVGEHGAYVDFNGDHWCRDCYIGNTNYTCESDRDCWFCGNDIEDVRVYKDSDNDMWCVRCVVENGEGMAY